VVGALLPQLRPGRPAGPILPGKPQPAAALPMAPLRARVLEPIRPQVATPAAVQPQVGNAFPLPANFALKPRSSGQPLPEPIRKKMEVFFNTSFADVRVHVGHEASSIGALAFTHSADVYFAPGQYNPESLQGQQLLGHELTHVVQQRAGRVRNLLGTGIAVVQDRVLEAEAEAERMALRAAAATLPIQAKPAGVGSAVAPARAAGPRLNAIAANRAIQTARSFAKLTVQRKAGPVLPGASLLRTKDGSASSLLSASGPGGRSARLPGSSVIQPQLRPYSEFLSSVRLMIGKKNEHYLRAKQAAIALNQIKPDAPNNPFERADVLKAYEEYDQTPSLETMIELFEAITYWEALNHVFAGEPWFKSATYSLATVKDLILDEVRKETEARYGDEKAIALAKKADDVRSKKDQKWSAVMPPFLKNVGVSPLYYGTHLRKYPERVERLQEFYDALGQGNVKTAEEAYKHVKDVHGMYLVKPLIVEHFAGDYEHLRGLFRTPSLLGQPLTRQEKKAIESYSSQNYLDMNADLRNALTSPETWRSEMELVVSGLNKLPPFKGIAYRAQVTEPGGYFDIIQPGHMIIDLAFQSASPSMKGVEEFLTSQTGPRHIYLMIHSKTAVNITGFALSKREGEVLFKPGARFRVRAIWHHIGGLVPPNAPPEAQLILHSKGEFKARGTPRDTGFSTGMTAAYYETKYAPFHPDLAEAHEMAWYKVKVIEIDEVT
jgi:hypothetical protein